MIYKFLMVALGGVLMFGVSMSAQAETAQYSFDKAHTQILFHVNHLGFSNSWGEFLEYDGHILFDKAAPEIGKVEITIKTASIDMDDEKWDTHMKSEDFFHVEKFPDMVFKSTGIEVTGDDTANIMGALTILGVTKPVTLVTTHNKSAKHPFSGKYVSGFSASATIKRSDFGMGYGLPLIGDEVQIMLEVEAIRQEQAGEGLGNH